MVYKLLADFVLLLHFGFILFVLFGVLLAYKYPKLVWLHIPVAMWGMMISFYRWICPLTPLENYFRNLAGEQGYQTGFIEHYLLPLIYPGGMTEKIAISMGIFVLVWNSIFYAVLIFRNKRRT